MPLLMGGGLHALTVSGTNVTSLRADKVPITIASTTATPLVFDNVAFTNMQTGTDQLTARALRAASALHGSHGCAGVVLGARLALSGVGALGIDWPDTKKRLLVTAETDRCAVDALQAITGCRPGKRTLRLLDYGKLAATFVDTWTDRAVRIAVRGDAREVAEAMEPGTAEDRHERQRRAYLTMPHSQLFTKTAVSAAVSQFDLPGPPRRRVLCAQCREEVSDGREVVTDGGTFCRPCAVVRDSQ